MSINTGTLKKEVIVDSKGKLAVAFFDEDEQIKAIFPLLESGEEIIDSLETIVGYKQKTTLPREVYELEKRLSEIYNLYQSAFILDETVDFFKQQKEVDQKVFEDLSKSCKAAFSYIEEILELYADMHPLWMGHEYRGMKYRGQNPYNMYPGLKYAVPEMMDMVIPKRELILSFAFGCKNFDVVDMSVAYCGKDYIAKENDYWQSSIGDEKS